MMRTSFGMIIVTLLFANPVIAQQQTRSARAEAAYQLRIEMASVLLQSKRYAEAEREYRSILLQRPNNFVARLGLARALAWSKRHREAETELQYVRAQQPGNRDVDRLLRSVRSSLEPRSDEASKWVGEDPNYAPYRRALARALMRERRARDAAPHYERLVSLDMSTPLVVETAHAYLESRQYDKADALLRRALGRSSRDAQLLLTRAQLNLARRDLKGAEADALASLAIASSPDAYLLLGDVRSLRANYGEARTAYGYARMLNPNGDRVRAANAQLMRAERPVAAFVTSNPADGWHLRSATINDNAGVTYATAGARRAVDIGSGSVIGLDVELRHLREQSPDIDQQISGAAFTAGLAHDFVNGDWLMQMHAHGGLVHHANHPMFNAGAGVSSWYGPWALSLDVAHRPAYPTLFTTAAILSEDEPALTETSVGAALGGPIGIVDVAVSAQTVGISDGNQRSTLQGLMRTAAGRNIALLAAANAVWFEAESERYWAPESYLSVAAGLEVSARKPLGASIAVRGLVGPARSVENDEIHAAVQYTAGLDLGYRTAARDVGVVINYGSGRAGSYRRFEASVYAGLR